MKRNAITVLMTLGLMTTAASASPGAADDRLRHDPVNWTTRTNIAPADLQTLIDGGAWRVTDVRVESTSPLRLSAVLVDNSGPYQVDGEFLFHGLTWDDQVAAFENNHRRPIVMQGYVDDNDTTRWVGISIPNTGANFRQWMLVLGDAAQVIGALPGAASSWRPITLATYLNGNGDRRYMAIAVANLEGYNYWYEFHLPPSQVQTFVDGHGPIIDASANDDDQMGLNVLCYSANNVGGNPWWEWGHTDLVQHLHQGGLRPLFITHYTQQGGALDGTTRYFSAAAAD
jgi:hypothetical protein